MPAVGLTRIVVSLWLLLSTRVIDLRALQQRRREGVNVLALGCVGRELRRLFSLHIAHLSDATIDNHALQHINDNLPELNSVWLTH